MIKRLTKDTLIKLLMFSAIIVVAGLILNQQHKEEVLRKDIIKKLTESLKLKEINTKKKIFSLEQEISKLKSKNSEVQKKIEKTESNYKKIIRNLKAIDDEKTKQDLEIINSDSDSDWIWFKLRFPKSEINNRLSIKTDSIVREPS